MRCVARVDGDKRRGRAEVPGPQPGPRPAVAGGRGVFHRAEKLSSTLVCPICLKRQEQMCTDSKSASQYIPAVTWALFILAPQEQTNDRATQAASQPLGGGGVFSECTCTLKAAIETRCSC